MQFTERDSAGVAQARGAKGGEDLSPESSSKAAFLSPSRRVDFCPMALLSCQRQHPESIIKR